MKSKTPTNKILDDQFGESRETEGYPLHAFRGLPGKVNRWLMGIEKLLIHAAALITLAMMLLTAFEISLRKLAGYSIEGVYEGVELMLVSIVYLGLARVQCLEKNVRVEVLLTRIPFKARLVLESFTMFLTACFCGLAIWMTGKEAWASWLIKETTLLPAALPVYIARGIITLGFFFLWLRFLFQIGERICSLAGTSEAPSVPVK
jgi:TRAP-type mannitol/chloroaromatic compound transport system permease small subunit